MTFLPTRTPSARAAAHRAMAHAALFSNSSASTRLKRYRRHMAKARALEEQAGLPTFVVYLARSGARLEIQARSWQDALRSTGRDDATLVEQVGERAYSFTFLPDTPQVIDTRVRHGTACDALQGGLECVVAELDREMAGGVA